MSVNKKILAVFPRIKEIHDQINISKNISRINEIFKKEVEMLDLELIKNCVCQDEVLVEEVARYIVSSGGKRIRPLLLFAAASLCESDAKLHVNMATAIELMHTATLLHDDVVDQSPQRRGQTSVAFAWNNSVSVLVGDFLLGQSLRLMVKQGSLEALTLLSETSTIIARGEVTQLRYMRNLDVSLEVYESIITAKTGALFRSATETAAIIAGVNSEKRYALREFGHYLGVAFQVIDDVLDITAGQDLGKRLGQDLIDGKVTLPISYAYLHGGDTLKKRIRRCIQDNDTNKDLIHEIIHEIKQSHVIDYCLDYAKKMSKKASDSLGVFQPSHAKTVLLDLLEFGIQRIH